MTPLLLPLCTPSLGPLPLPAFATNKLWQAALLPMTLLSQRSSCDLAEFIIQL